NHHGQLFAAHISGKAVKPADGITHREFVEVTAEAVTPGESTAYAAPTSNPADSFRCTPTINGQRHALSLDARVSGTCTVLVNGMRVNSCADSAHPVKSARLWSMPEEWRSGTPSAVTRKWIRELPISRRNCSG